MLSPARRRHKDGASLIPHEGHLTTTTILLLLLLTGPFRLQQHDDDDDENYGAATGRAEGVLSEKANGPQQQQQQPFAARIQPLRRVHGGSGGFRRCSEPEHKCPAAGSCLK
ncbi:unnamed protein product [Gongylonema pulchrum]|uniref:Uncharacterized protein n=1 Tax=Gongylonema pulchrum TaxID=637853 RepID=A0A183DNX8_9BILA|nr:unnamed protein product [Gongylonema pulchrum]